MKDKRADAQQAAQQTFRQFAWHLATSLNATKGSGRSKPAAQVPKGRR